MKARLYSYFRSSSSYRVRIALNLKNIDCEITPIHLVKDGGQQHSLEYKLLNPRGEVPFYIDEDVAISESMAILYYLDEKHKSAPLFPKNLKERVKCIQICEMINAGIQPLQNLKVLKEIKNRYQLSEEQKIEWAKFWIEEGLAPIEITLSKTSKVYSLGDSVSAVDLFLIPQIYNALRFGVDLKKFPTLSKINQTCLSMDAFKLASPEAQPDFSA